MNRVPPTPRWTRWAAHCAMAAAAAVAPSCSFLLDFPAEGSGPVGGGGSGGGSGGGTPCTPFATETCAAAEPTAISSGCTPGTRVCEEDGSGFGPCQCAAPTWADSFSSATGTARGTSVAVAPDGSVVVAGVFTGSLNFGGTTLSSVGQADLFLARFSAAGEHQWSRSFGNTMDQITEPVIDVDSTGSVVMAGGFTGNISFGGQDLVGSGSFGNAFVAKLDASGTHQWSHGHGNRATVTSVDIGWNDGIAVAGVFREQISFPPIGFDLFVSATETETFVARLDAGGNGIWQTAQSTSGYEDTRLLVRVAPSGDAVAGGFFMGDFLGTDVVMFSSATPIAYAISYSYDQPNDDLNVVWAAPLGGVGSQVLAAMAIDDAGDVILAGSYKGTLAAGTQPVLQSADTSEDFFLVKLGATAGAALWSKGLSETGATLPTTVAVDSTGTITVAGSIAGEVDFGGGPISLPTAATDASFLAKYGPGGAHVWSKTFGAEGALVSFGDIAADPTTRELAATGHLVGSADLGSGTLTATDGVFVAKLAP